MTDTKQEKDVLVIGNGFDLYHCFQRDILILLMW